MTPSEAGSRDASHASRGAGDEHLVDPFLRWEGDVDCGAVSKTVVAVTPLPRLRIPPPPLAVAVRAYSGVVPACRGRRGAARPPTQPRPPLPRYRRSATMRIRLFSASAI